MDRVVAARKLIGELVKGEQIEVRRAEIVGRDLAQLCESLGRAPTGRELEDFLGDHQQVTELYASTTLLEELVDRHLVRPVDPAAFADVRNPDLERQIRESPDNVDAYLVYADWLQEHNDPFEKLIALGAKGEQARFERFLHQHASRFLPLSKARLGPLALRWRYGVVHEIEEGFAFDRVHPDVWDELLALRVCDFVQTISIARSDPSRILARCAPSSVRLPHLRELPADAPHGVGASPRRRGRPHATVARGAAAGARSPRVARARARGRDAPLARRRGARHAAHAPAAPEAAEARGARDRPRGRQGNDAAGEARRARRAGAASPHAVERHVRHEDVLEAWQDSPGRAAVVDGAHAARADRRRHRRDDEGARSRVTELELSFNELTRAGLDAARALAPNIVSKRQGKPGNARERRIRKFAGTRLQVAEDIADPKAWKDAGVDGDMRWARYRGNDEYELFVSADLERYGCTCPSSIQPCKHVVALALVAERTELREASSAGLVERVGQRRQEATWE